MAIVVEILVPGASREEADRFDATMSDAMDQGDGPPDGLMVHLCKPVGEGFALVNVWRNEADAQPFLDGVILPKLAAAGLTHEEPSISPVWTFARP